MELNPNTAAANKLFLDGAKALARVSQQGMQIDVPKLKKNQKKLSKDIVKLEKEFKASKFYKQWDKSVAGNVNIYSKPQLSTFLYKVKKVKVLKETAKGNASTDSETLKRLNIPELSILLEISKLKKIRDTFLAGILREQVDGVLHPFFTLHNVSSFRSASKNPNLQNLSKRNKVAAKLIRGCILPRKGNQLMELDFKSLEVSMGVTVHKDPTMRKYLLDEKSDMHRDMTKEIYLIKKYDSEKHGFLRSSTKNGFVFPQFYGDYYKNNANSLACVWNELPKGTWKDGMGVDNIAGHLIKQGIKSYSQFEKHLQGIEYDFWNKRFKVYSRWKDKIWKQYQEKGYIDSLTGFRFNAIMDKKQASNYPIQAIAFHCLLWSLIQIDKMLHEEGWKSRIVGEIHDSIVFDAHPKEVKKLVKRAREIMTVKLMEHWEWINVPLAVTVDLGGIDESWNKVKETKL